MVRILRKYDKRIKKEVERLRQHGSTYKEIYNVFRIPKSTLSDWLGEKYPGVFDKKAQLIHLAKIRPLAMMVLKKEREETLEILRKKVNSEINNYPLNNIALHKAMLAMLYWAEGAKHDKVGGLGFVNTDPLMANFYITLLRKCYDINEEKLRIRLHLHYYHSIKEAKKFWSRLLKIPENQFGKIYIKKRSKTKRFRKNFKGICFIRYSDGKIRKELLEIAYQLANLINNVPVAQRIEHSPAEGEVGRSNRPRDAQ